MAPRPHKFEWALKQLRAGKGVRRAAWHPGVGMRRPRDEFGIAYGMELEYKGDPWKTWHPVGEDVFAEDWEAWNEED